MFSTNPLENNPQHLTATLESKCATQRPTSRRDTAGLRARGMNWQWVGGFGSLQVPYVIDGRHLCPSVAEPNNQHQETKPCGGIVMAAAASTTTASVTMYCYVECV